jgi:hypothetical protein
LPGYHANSSVFTAEALHRLSCLCESAHRGAVVSACAFAFRILSEYVHSCCLAAKRSKAPQRKAKAQTNVPDSTKPAPATKPKRAPSKKRTEADEVAGDAADEEIENADLSASVLHSVRWARLVLDEAHKIKASLLRARVPSFVHWSQLCSSAAVRLRCARVSAASSDSQQRLDTGLHSSTVRRHRVALWCSTLFCVAACCSLARRRRPRQSMRSAPT